MEASISVTIKVLPPFTMDSRIVEKTLHLRENSSIMDLLAEASNQGILAMDKIINSNEVVDGVVILVNGRTVFDVRSRLDNGDRVVVMPLAPGG